LPSQNSPSYRLPLVHVKRHGRAASRYSGGPALRTLHWRISQSRRPRRRPATPHVCCAGRSSGAIGGIGCDCVSVERGCRGSAAIENAKMLSDKCYTPFPIDPVLYHCAWQQLRMMLFRGGAGGVGVGGRRTAPTSQHRVGCHGNYFSLRQQNIYFNPCFRCWLDLSSAEAEGRWIVHISALTNLETRNPEMTPSPRYPCKLFSFTTAHQAHAALCAALTRWHTHQILLPLFPPHVVQASFRSSPASPPSLRSSSGHIIDSVLANSPATKV
jgi:hypothetical protein